MKKIFFFLSFFIAQNLFAQDDLLNMLQDKDSNEVNYTTATFKTSRLINTHTTELQPVGELQFLINHRFGLISDGFNKFYGLDAAYVRLGFEYGINKFWSVGIGRSGVDRLYDGFTKIKLLRQSSGAKNIPISAVLFLGLAAKTLDYSDNTVKYETKHYLTYTSQLIVARKFNENFSLQLMPTYVHRNLANTQADANGIFVMGIGGRLKLTKRFGIIGEYHYIFNDQLKKTFYDPISLGFEIETGGHVFQLHVSNSRGMVEPQYLTQTEWSWGKGDIHFGFNIARTFSLSKKARGL